MKLPPFVVRTMADMDRLIAFAQEHAPHRVPLYRAYKAGVCNVCELQRDMKIPVGDFERSGRPSIVLVGDDDDMFSGPDAWTARPRLAGWARYAIVHATGGDVPTYEAALRIAYRCGRLALVETTTTHVMAWQGIFARAGVPTLNLVSPNGAFHPVPATKGELH